MRENGNSRKGGGGPSKTSTGEMWPNAASVARKTKKKKTKKQEPNQSRTKLETHEKKETPRASSR